MTDRTDEFRGAVKVFRPTVPTNKTGRNNRNDSTSSGVVAPHLQQQPTENHQRQGQHQRQQQQFPSFFDDDDAEIDGKGMGTNGMPRYSKPEASEFLQMAASVAVGFEGTTKLIERLKKLVGRKGFSNNPAAEISDVMKLFEGDMAGLQKDIAALQRYANGDSRGSPPKNSQRQVHCQHIVDTLRHSFQEHTKAFRDALLLRAAVEKQQSDRQRKFSHSRGVAPATQLDYPLFGNSLNANKHGELRSRNTARRPSPPPRPPPPPSPSVTPPHSGGFAAGGEGVAAGLGVGMGAPGGGWSGQPFRVATPAAAAAVAGPLSGPARSGGRSGGGDGQRSLYPPGTSSGNGGVGVGGGGIDGHSQGGNLQSRGPAVSAAQFGGVATPFDANGSSGSAYGGGAPGVGEGGGGGGGVTYGASRYGRGPGAAAPMPPTEQFRAGTGAFGLRKRGGGGDVEEEARRAAWQVQVQEDSKNRVEESHKVEKMIGDLGQMFTRFSTMVAAQEEVVLHIEDDVEAAHAFAEEGQAHLAKYYQVISGNRGIIVKVFILLIFFIWLFLGLMR